MGTELNNFAEKLQKYKMPASGRRAELVEQRTKWQVLFPRRDCVGETKTENIAVSYVNTSSVSNIHGVSIPSLYRSVQAALNEQCSGYRCSEQIRVHTGLERLSTLSDA
jgi:hypothetical protein